MCQQTADQHHLLLLLLQHKDLSRLVLLQLLVLGAQVGLVADAQVAVLVVLAGPTGHVQRGAGQGTSEAMGHQHYVGGTHQKTVKIAAAAAAEVAVAAAGVPGAADVAVQLAVTQPAAAEARLPAWLQFERADCVVPSHCCCPAA
jgi:hypothetical protein